MGVGARDRHAVGVVAAGWWWSSGRTPEHVEPRGHRLRDRNQFPCGASWGRAPEERSALVAGDPKQACCGCPLANHLDLPAARARPFGGPVDIRGGADAIPKWIVGAVAAVSIALTGCSGSSDRPNTSAHRERGAVGCRDTEGVRDHGTVGSGGCRAPAGHLLGGAYLIRDGS